MKRIIALQNRGFTIVELMIALSVLSILLLISTLTLMNLGSMYVKGNNQANVQNTARNILEDISSQLQFGGSTPIINLGSGSGSLCFGTTRYNYLIGQQVGGSTKHAMWRDTMSSGGSCPGLPNMQAAAPSDSLTQKDSSGNPVPGTELIPAHMRLANFFIQPISQESGVYQISVSVAYGDDDLLCVRDEASDCDSSWISQNAPAHALDLQNINPDQQVGCVAGAGQQYCAVSNLSVTVAERLVSD